MRRATVFVMLLVLLLPAAFPVNAGSNFIIIRAEVSPLYIVGESIQIRAFALVFRDGKPTDESATLSVKLKGIDTKYNANYTYTIRGGKKATYYLPALEQGYYKIKIQATKGTLKSQTMTFEFGVTHAPVPYFLEFSPGGDKIYFKSLRHDENGSIDPNYPFTLYIYQMQHGAGETLINTLKNVTNITYTIPKQLRSGIISVEVVDCYGWRNSASIDLSSFSFSGEPVMYDYEWRERYPIAERTLKQIGITIAIIILLFIALFIFVRWYEDVR